MTFTLDKPYRLSALKVVESEDAATNKYPHALWDLTAVGNTNKPVMEFVYSWGIQGMKPAIAGVHPEPLVAGVKYRLLLVDENKLKGQIDFTVKN